MDHDTKNHARLRVFSHLIFVCKYRKKLLNTYGNEVKQVFEEIAARSDVSFEAMEVDQDPIHSSGEKRTEDIAFGSCTSIETNIDHSALAKTGKRGKKALLEGTDILE